MTVAPMSSRRLEMRKTERVNFTISLCVLLSVDLKAMFSIMNELPYSLSASLRNPTPIGYLSHRYCQNQ